MKKKTRGSLITQLILVFLVTLVFLPEAKAEDEIQEFHKLLAEFNASLNTTKNQLSLLQQRNISKHQYLEPVGDSKIISAQAITPVTDNPLTTLPVTGSEALPAEIDYSQEKLTVEPDRILDCQGLFCPEPVFKTRMELDMMKIGETINVIADDPAAEEDIKSLVKNLGQKILKVHREGNIVHFLIQKVK